jgi:hypothetical protein
MKKIIFLLALFLVVAVSYSATTEKLNTHEKTISTHDIAIDAVFVQNQAVATNSGTFENGEGFYLCNVESYRYYSSIETSGYGSFIEINTRAIGNTYTNKIEARNNISTENWQSNTSGMLLRSTGSCSEDIQRDYYQANTNYRSAKANHYFNSKQNTCVAETIFMDRNCSCNRHTCTISKTISIA